MPTSIVIDKIKCTGCGRCSRVCISGCLDNGEDGRVRVSDNIDNCIGCGHCAAVCPVSCISLPDNTELSSSPIDISMRLSYDHFLEFISMRRSRREFKDKPVPADIINKLIIAASYAPSALNRQCVEYSVITDREKIRKISVLSVSFMAKTANLIRNPFIALILKIFRKNLYKSLTALLPLIDIITEKQASGRDMITYDAPCIIMLHSHKLDSLSAEDSLFNSMIILLAAETLGLGGCVIDFVTHPSRRVPEIGRLAEIPADHIVNSTIIIGYPEFEYKHTVHRQNPKVEYV